MPRALLVDTNRAAVPIYRALCGLGHEVTVVGSNPDETLAKLAADYVELDYSDRKRLASFVEERAFDYLVPGCTDLSYQVCAEINDGRFAGLDAPAAERTINSKKEFRKVAYELGLRVPRVLSLEQAKNVGQVIVKPIDSFSGRGISILDCADEDEFRSAYDKACRASQSGEAIIEEYIDGQLFSHSAFVRDGHVTADFIVQEDCRANPFAVDTSRVATEFSQQMRMSLRADILRLVLSLNLVDGLVHTQFIVRADEYWLIETTRRCPGDLYSLLIEYSTGYPYAFSYASQFVEEESARQEAADVREMIVRHTVSPMRLTSFWGFQFSRPVDIKLCVPLVTSGSSLEPGPSGRAGIFFFRVEGKEQQEELYQALLDGELYALD